MRISTEIDSIASFVGEEKAIEYVAQAGFDCWDFSMFRMARYDWARASLLPNDHPLAGSDYLAFARRLRRVGESFGLVCNQSHAPFPVSCEAIRKLLPRAIECTAEAGGSICVIHPDNNKTASENAKMYQELLPYAREYGVRIATENMWNWDKELDVAVPAACSGEKDFLAHIEAVADPFLVACVDVGHAEMRGLSTSAARMIRTLGPHVAALHLQDVDGHHDNHDLPGLLNVDFRAVTEALREIDYRGDFTLEASRFLSLHSSDDIPGGVAKMAEAARRLVCLYQAR